MVARRTTPTSLGGGGRAVGRTRSIAREAMAKKKKTWRSSREEIEIRMCARAPETGTTIASAATNGGPREQENSRHANTVRRGRGRVDRNEGVDAGAYRGDDDDDDDDDDDADADDKDADFSARRRLPSAAST